MNRRSFMKAIAALPFVGLAKFLFRPEKRGLPAGFKHIDSYKGQKMPNEFGDRDNITYYDLGFVPTEIHTDRDGYYSAIDIAGRIHTGNLHDKIRVI